MNFIVTIAALFFPMVIWIGIVSIIMASVKGNFKRASGGRQRNRNYGQQSRNDRPLPKKDIFEMKLPKPGRKTSFGNSGFDDYSAKGRRKDFVSGYDKKYTDGTSYRRARGQQFAHTYDGHEPWDKCLPKEKDPWDKDFYV